MRKAPGSKAACQMRLNFAEPDLSGTRQARARLSAGSARRVAYFGRCHHFGGGPFGLSLMLTRQGPPLSNLEPAALGGWGIGVLKSKSESLANNTRLG